MNEYQIYIDGASQGNPGPAGIGVIITRGGQVVRNMSVYLGEQTNNFAEYSALIFGLQEALVLRAKRVKVFSDSELLCRQLKNKYKIKSKNLIGLFEQARHLLSAFEHFEIESISRQLNRGADKLAKAAIKQKHRAQAPHQINPGQAEAATPTPIAM